jgi:hypothetical protein
LVIEARTSASDFEEHSLSYEQWKSVLRLSTLWGFASLRKLALRSINPPTPFDQLLLARAHSVDHWILPALSALCERTVPLSLNEARQMSIEDVVLINTVREDIRHHALQVVSHEIPHCVEAAQAVMHAVAAGHSAFASEGAKGETPTKPSPSNGTERSARSTAAVANNVGAEGENDDLKTAVATSPVDIRRGEMGRDSGLFEVRSATSERSSRPSSAWGKILVVPSPTVSRSPQSPAWSTAPEPPVSHAPHSPAWSTADRPESPDPSAWPGRKSGWIDAPRPSPSPANPVGGDPSVSDGGVRTSAFGFSRHAASQF